MLVLEKNLAQCSVDELSVIGTIQSQKGKLMRNTRVVK